MAYDKKEASSDYTQSPTQIEYNTKRQQKVIKFLKKFINSTSKIGGVPWKLF